MNESHTGLAIATKLRRVMEEYAIGTKVEVLICDGASNMLKGELL